jgi:hypothetical protein
MAAILLVSTVAILTPRVVRAVTAELVQNVDNPPRNSWVGSCQMPAGQLSFNGCTIAAEPGQVITIQTVTFQGYATGHSHLVLQLEVPIAPQLAIWENEITSDVVPTVPQAPGVKEFASSRSLTLYAPYSTQGILVQVLTDGDNTIFPPATVGVSGLGGTVTLIGYTVNTTPSSGTN